MNIPSRFKLFGQTIEVVLSHKPFVTAERDGCVGFASYRLNQIQISPDCEGRPRTQEQIEQTFLHELVHHISYLAGGTVRLKGDAYLHQQEEFVDLFASLLHQALTTAEYSGE